MKARFFLALLAFNGSILAAHSASANSGSIDKNHYDIAHLSRTISAAVKLDPDTHSLVEMAISRALIAQKASNVPEPQPQMAGGIPAPNFTSDPQQQPIINGKIVNPNPPKIKPRVRRIAEPPKPQPDRKATRTAGAAPQSQPLRPGEPKASQQSAPKIDRPAAKKLSECKAPISNNLDSVPVNNSIDRDRSKVTVDNLIKPIIPASSVNVTAPKSAPPVRHFIGARG